MHAKDDVTDVGLWNVPFPSSFSPPVHSDSDPEKRLWGSSHSLDTILSSSSWESENLFDTDEYVNEVDQSFADDTDCLSDIGIRIIANSGFSKSPSASGSPVSTCMEQSSLVYEDTSKNVKLPMNTEIPSTDVEEYLSIPWLECFLSQENQEAPNCFCLSPDSLGNSNLNMSYRSNEGHEHSFLNDFRDAYLNGDFKSYFWKILTPPDEEAPFQWQGYLPLGPANLYHGCSGLQRHTANKLIDPEEEVLVKFLAVQACPENCSYEVVVRKPFSSQKRASFVTDGPLDSSSAEEFTERNPEIMLTLECAGAEKVFSPDHYASLTYFNLLPTLRNSIGEEREELILLKLKLCSVIFPFYKSTSKEVEKCKYIKRQYLLEMVDLLNISAGHSIFTEQVMGAFVECMAVNIFRVLPPKTEDNNEEGNGYFSEPSWPHLQIAYELLLRFIESPEIHPKTARKFVDRKFLRQMLDLFDSQDPRERDYLKAILHRTYAKFVCHRVWLRNQICNIFNQFVYETGQHNGIKELLETLGSIINGFAIPLKKEHVEFLIRAVIPLHKPEKIYPYHKELSNCMIQYIEKDGETGKVILSGILKFWPWCSSSKQIKFLNELEDILQHLSGDQIAPLREMLFTSIARCLESEHFQIVERCLYLWNNQLLLDSENLFHLNSTPCLPIIYGSLNKLASGHWYASIQEHAQKILIMYKDFDSVGFESVARNYAEQEADANTKLQVITNKWYAFHEISQSNQFKDLV